jgi:phosphoribosylformylglycinamidine synthase
VEGIHALGAIGKSVTAVSVVDAYTTDAHLSKAELDTIARALHTPLSQTYTVDQPSAPKDFAYAIEIGFLPGVTDNVGRTAKETAEGALGRPFTKGENIYSSRVYYLAGSLSETDAVAVAGSLHNPLIERASVKSYAQFTKDGGMDVVVPRVKLTAGPVTTVNLYVSDEDLAVIGKKGVPNGDGTHRGPLGLGTDELKVMRNYFHRLGRLPTDVEVEALAQTWSEHCKHTIFANPLDDITEGIYKHYIKRATREVRKKKGAKDFCVSVFSDNSGVIVFDADTYLTHKVETHNSPSALDPFGGAVTGIVGVNRDTIGTGLGAKPILNTYGYCFADPDDDTRLWRDQGRTEELLSARRIMDGVIAGVNAGGNQSGIATPQGFAYFHPQYRGKPLVFVGTVGMLPKKVKGKAAYKKAAQPGDYIVMLGGRVGLDGIHGATFSSEALDAGSPATAVQIGDAITQKKFSDALVKEARDRGLYNSVTDNGAGGLSSSVGEMAGESGGCEVKLDAVPVKYGGLSPWQIWISESQERMTLAVSKKHWPAFKKLMDTRGCEATVIGTFTDSGVCRVTYGKDTVLELDMEFMHNGNPVHALKTSVWRPVVRDVPATVIARYEKDLRRVMTDLLARPNIGSTAFISTQYDHEVQGVSVTKPLQGKGRVNAPASVSRPHTATNRGIVLSQGLCPTYSDLDPYRMAASAIDQAVRNAVAIGADPDHVALLDNFCWCSSDEPERLYQLKETARACYECAVAYQTPFISGKDSMFNDFKGFDASGQPVKISVPPTLLVSSIAVMPDVRRSATLDMKRPGHLVYLLGETHPELGGAEYIAYLAENERQQYTGATVPAVDAAMHRSLYKKYHTAVQKGLVASALALAHGGLAIALAKSAIAGQCGVHVDLAAMPGSAHTTTERLFSESNGRLLVTVSAEKAARFERLLNGVPVAKIGTVTSGSEITIVAGARNILSLDIKAATTAYRSKFKNS